MTEIWIPEMLTAGKYPENEEEMLQYNLDTSLSNKFTYELISEYLFHSKIALGLFNNSRYFSEPELRFKPALIVIDFEMELYRESSKN